MERRDENRESYEERQKVMDRVDLSFGQGSRSCIGKSVAMLELFKVVATLMGQFQVSSCFLALNTLQSR